MLSRLRKLVAAIAHRTTKRFDVIKIRSLPKTYWDKDEILLHAVMQLVVDFVEIECSFMELDAPYTFREWFNMKLPWFLRSCEAYRSRERGLRHLESISAALDPAMKTDAYATIREVYLWWKDVRPNRLDADSSSGWYECAVEAHLLQERPSSKSVDRKLKRALKLALKLEEQYEREDTKMLKKVIDVRGYMWT